MTTTNQAFIKAYRTDEPQIAPTGPTMAGGARPHASAAQAAAELAAVTSAAPANRSAIYGPRPMEENRSVVSGSPDPISVVRGSHDPAVRPTEGLRYRQDTPAASIVVRSGDRPQHTSAGEKRPLSSFIASTGIARLGTERTEGDFFRPGTTIASFHWPDVCRTLMRSCGDQLAQVADLLVTHADAGRSLVAVVAMRPGDGATTTALCLASRLAERRRRVIVVDGNFRKPCLAKCLEAEPTAGWQDVLKHGAPLTDAVVRATHDRLDLLALGEKMPNDTLRLVSGLQAVVTAGVLRHEYEHVILDGGAFADAASQPLLLELLRNMGIDAAIAVTGPASVEPQQIDALAGHLSRMGCEFLGVVKNRIAKPPLDKLGADWQAA